MDQWTHKDETGKKILENEFYILSLLSGSLVYLVYLGLKHRDQGNKSSQGKSSHKERQIWKLLLHLFTMHQQWLCVILEV